MKLDEIRDKAESIANKILTDGILRQGDPVATIETALLEVDKQARKEGYLKGADDCYRAFKSKPSTASGKDGGI